MNNKKRIILSVILLFALAVLLTSCMPSNGTNAANPSAGFFSGIWHGWIAPFSLITSIVDKNIGIYEVNNNGFLYNLGFYMAIISPFGCLSLSRSKKK